jgi:hypothetical protein
VFGPKIFESLGLEGVPRQGAIVKKLDVVAQVGLQSKLVHQPGLYGLAVAGIAEILLALWLLLKGAKIPEMKSWNWFTAAVDKTTRLY